MRRKGGQTERKERQIKGRKSDTKKGGRTNRKEDRNKVRNEDGYVDTLTRLRNGQIHI